MHGVVLQNEDGVENAVGTRPTTNYPFSKFSKVPYIMSLIKHCYGATAFTL